MSRRRRSTCRSASLCITLFGALTNSALTLHVLSAWQQLKWGDVESEWAGDSWPQVVDGVKVMWALLSLYFISAASVCAIGFVGSIRVRHRVFYTPIYSFTFSSTACYRAKPRLSGSTETIRSQTSRSVHYSHSGPPMPPSFHRPAPVYAKNSLTTHNSCVICMNWVSILRIVNIGLKGLLLRWLASCSSFWLSGYVTCFSWISHLILRAAALPSGGFQLLLSAHPAAHSFIKLQCFLEPSCPFS